MPVIGTFVGACLGAGFGAWGLELTAGKKMDHSIRSGVGAGLGVLIGTGCKLALGALICIIVAVAAFWP